MCIRSLRFSYKQQLLLVFIPVVLLVVVYISMSNFIQNRNQYNEINSQSDIYISSNPQILYSQEYVNEKGQSVSQDVYAMPAIDKTILDLLTTNEGVDRKSVV